MAAAGAGEPVIRRGVWTEYAPQVAEMTPMRAISAITIHHSGFPEGFRATGTEDAADNLRFILAFHTAHLPTGRGWADIGYHFAIDPAGRVWELRSLQYQGAHVKNHNAGNIGVVCLGNFDLQPLPPEQWAALLRLVKGIERHFGRIRVVGHRDIADEATSCPGEHLYHALTAIGK